MRLLLLLLLFSCSDIFIPNDETYKSIYFTGNGWIEIEDQYENDCDYGLRIMDNDFTLEIFFSGEKSDNAATIFSLMGKKTEYYTDEDCNGSFDSNDGEIDEDLNGELDIINDDDYVVLLVATHPPFINKLFFYINDNHTIIEFDDIDFTDSDEFHLMQVLSDGQIIKFYLDNELVLEEDANIMIQGSSLMVGAKVTNNAYFDGWHGYIDEVRLWKESLSENLRQMHYQFPYKLVDTIEDSSICNLRGLWKFDLEHPSIDIPDEKCTEISNLYLNPCEINLCNYPLDASIRGNAIFSTKQY